MALSLAEQLRAAHVRRWHIVQVAREQTLAEHMYCVAMIAGSLAVAMRWEGLMHASGKLQLLHWALSHDILEVRTGDMPTPFKKMLEQVAGEGVVEKAETLIDNDAGGEYRLVKGTPIEMIVKLADLMEAIKFLKENGVGSHAADVCSGILKDLHLAVEKYNDKFPNFKVRTAVHEVGGSIGLWELQV